jgi:hypothetical protein
MPKSINFCFTTPIPEKDEGYLNYYKKVKKLVKAQEKIFGIDLPKNHREAMAKGIANVCYKRDIDATSQEVKNAIRQAFFDWMHIK